MRGSASSFTPVRQMLKGEGDDSQIITLKLKPCKLAEIKAKNLPEEVQVRLVRVRLETGEYEVLITNLIDEIEFPTEDVLSIYHLRWGAEGFDAIVKTRLNLENWSNRRVNLSGFLFHCVFDRT